MFKCSNCGINIKPNVMAFEINQVLVGSKLIKKSSIVLCYACSVNRIDEEVVGKVLKDG